VAEGQNAVRMVHGGAEKRIPPLAARTQGYCKSNVIGEHKVSNVKPKVRRSVFVQ
jgi:hypothetical protein